MCIFIQFPHNPNKLLSTHRQFQKSNDGSLYTHQRSQYFQTTQCCFLRHDAYNQLVSCKAGKISHVLCNSEMSTAHINSLLLTAPILNTLKLSDFCCIEFDAMKSRELSFMMQDHFKIPVSFSAALLRFYTAVGHQSIIPNLAVSLSYGDRNKLF